MRATLRATALPLSSTNDAKTFVPCLLLLLPRPISIINLSRALAQRRKSQKSALAACHGPSPAAS
jgi:hypothetical protein